MGPKKTPTKTTSATEKETSDKTSEKEVKETKEATQKKEQHRAALLQSGLHPYQSDRGKRVQNLRPGNIIGIF